MAAEKSNAHPQQRVELHLHTVYSQMNGLTDIDQVFQKAQEWGQSAIAITDHGNVQGFLQAEQAAKKCGLKAIYGLESDYINDIEEAHPGTVNHIILLVRNREGLKNLYTLISEASQRREDQNPVLCKSRIIVHRSGLLVGSACTQGEVYCAIANSPVNDEAEALAVFYDYLEIQPIGRSNNLSDCKNTEDARTLRGYHLRIAEVAKKLGKPLIASGNVHCLHREDEICLHILQKAGGAVHYDAQGSGCFLSTGNMLDAFSYLGEPDCREAVITNPEHIAAQCDQVNLFPVPAVYPVKPDRSQDISQMCQSRVSMLYGKTAPGFVQNRLDAELGIILPAGFDIYYLIAQNLVTKSLKDGYPVGSRGGIAASFVAYLLEITDVNPLPPHYRCQNCLHSELPSQHTALCGIDLPEANCPVCGTEMVRDGFDISYESFLACSNGIRRPDVALNFSGEYRKRAIRHLEDMFGQGHILRIGTIGTLTEAMAGDLLSSFLAKKPVLLRQEEKQLIIKKLTQVKRTDGSLASCCAIIPQSCAATDFSPVQRVSGDSDRPSFALQLQYAQMKNVLIKLDIMSHDAVTMLHQMHQLTGIAPASIPLDDQKTLAGIAQNDMLGVPGFDSDRMGSILEIIRPACFSDLVKLFGFSLGTGVWEDNAELLLKQKSADIQDIIGTGDDIFQYFKSLGMPVNDAYTGSEKARQGLLFSGKGNDDWENKLHAYNVPEWYIHSLKKIRYLFPKAHAVVYAQQAFRIAWYKVHFPLAFYAACFYMQNLNGLFDAAAAIEGIEYTRKCLQIRGSNRSKKDFDNTARLYALKLLAEFFVRGYKFASPDRNTPNRKQFIPASEHTLQLPYGLSIFRSPAAAGHGTSGRNRN